MQKGRVLIIHFLWFAFIFHGCEDNPPPTQSEEVKAVWVIDETYFRTGKILLNANVAEGKFIVAGLSVLAVYDSTNAGQRISGTPDNNRALRYKPAMHGPFVMYAGSEGIQLYLNSPAYWRGNVVSAVFPFSYGFRLSDFDLSYSDKARVPVDFHTRMIGAFNNQNQFLTVISDTSRIFQGNLSFCLIDLNPTETVCSGQTCLEINPAIRRIQHQANISKFLSQIDSYEDLFFVSLQGDLFVIDANGNTNIAQNMSGRIGDFFTYHDTLYALRESHADLYFSVDKGYSWGPFASGFPSDQLRFFVIDDRLCFYVYSQIATLDLHKGIIQELDNSGLEGSEITSVNEYDGKIWITTLSGMFTKDEKDFFTVKESNLSNALPKTIGLVQ